MRLSPKDTILFFLNTTCQFQCITNFIHNFFSMQYQTNAPPTPHPPPSPHPPT